MAIIKAINSRASIGNAINYITKKEKTEAKLTSGYNCNAKTALFEMKNTKKSWNKTGGRQYKHFVQSFSANENITFEEAHKIATQIVESWNKFKGYEVVFATHKDRKHIHTHIIVNSVSFENGKKFCYSKKDLQNLKDISDKILINNNKSICQKNTEITTNNINTYKSLEKASNKMYDSWLLNIAINVTEAKKEAISPDNFIDILKSKGINTSWDNNRKYITFSDNRGNKVRNKKLADIFKIDLGKEVLLNEFKQNNRRKISTSIATDIRNREFANISQEIERRKSKELRENSTTRLNNQREYRTERNSNKKRNRNSDFER